MADAVMDRKTGFARDHLAWTTLHHFLPAPLVRELVVATLSVVRSETTLDDLFDESLATGPSVQATWALAARPVDDPDLRFLQDHIRAIGWGNDAHIPARKRGSDGSVTPFGALAAATRLGRFDLGAGVGVIEQLPLPGDSSGKVLASSIASAVRGYTDDSAEAWGAARAAIRTLPAPLDALGLKHLGDLCADADLWMMALDLYGQAAAATEHMDPCWAEFRDLFRDILGHSKAGALWSTKGALAALPELLNLAQVDESRATRLGVLNASHDALVAALAGPEFSGFEDRRPTVMSPPLLVQSWDVGHATQNWMKGARDQAHRHFWSVLRRQIALGSVADAKETKAAYGRTLIEEAVDGGRSNFDPGSFELGARLLVESGIAKTAAALHFEAARVERYLVVHLIEELAEIVDRQPGVRDERTLVFFELLAHWAPTLSVEQTGLGEAMLRQIIRRIRGRKAEFDGSRNIAGRGLKVLADLARSATRFRAGVATEVVDLVTEQLNHGGFWKGQEDALHLARLYVDVLSSDDLKRMLTPVAGILGQGEDPQQPFVRRAAMGFLMTPVALGAAARDPDLGSRFFREILRSGLEQGGEEIATLFHLGTFGPSLELEEQDAALLKTVVATVAEQAKALNSSSAVDAMRALLAAPAQVGPPGVDVAIEALIAMLSDGARHTPPAFAYAYGPVLDLLQRSDAIAIGAGFSAEEIQDRLERVLHALATAWSRIAEDPSRLAAFSIPRSAEPEPVLVHNWSMVTLRAIQAARDPALLESSLLQAEQVPALSDRIELARATSKSDLGGAEMDSAFRKESTDVFYQALGYRLDLTRDWEPAEADRVVGALLSEVLRRGPREADLAVFMAASNWEAASEATLAALDGYRARLQTRAGLYRLLEPAIRRVTAALTGESNTA